MAVRRRVRVPVDVNTRLEGIRFDKALGVPPGYRVTSQEFAQAYLDGHLSLVELLKGCAKNGKRAAAVADHLWSTKPDVAQQILMLRYSAIEHTTRLELYDWGLRHLDSRMEQAGAEARRSTAFWVADNETLFRDRHAEQLLASPYPEAHRAAAYRCSSTLARRLIETGHPNRDEAAINLGRRHPNDFLHAYGQHVSQGDDGRYDAGIINAWDELNTGRGGIQHGHQLIPELMTAVKAHPDAAIASIRYVMRTWKAKQKHYNDPKTGALLIVNAVYAIGQDHVERALGDEWARFFQQPKVASTLLNEIRLECRPGQKILVNLRPLP